MRPIERAAIAGFIVIAAIECGKAYESIKYRLGELEDGVLSLDLWRRRMWRKEKKLSAPPAKVPGN